LRIKNALVLHFAQVQAEQGNLRILMFKEQKARQNYKKNAKLRARIQLIIVNLHSKEEKPHKTINPWSLIFNL